MVGATLGHYEVIAKLGEGGMGVVYEARDRRLDRRVALKILPPTKMSDPARKQRFIQEAKAASALNHPNIITIYEIDSENGCDYIAMELVPGRTLDDIVSRRPPRLPDALRYAVQIADALAAAHAAGIVHRDLKPANVMVTETSLVKVLDFGLAKLTEAPEIGEDDSTCTARPVTEDGTVVGTAAYMSPEQTEGKKVDARSDIFSFGSVLYEILTGRRAFQGDSRMSTMAAVLDKEPQPVGELASGLPKELERIVARCLRKDLMRRSQSMAEIKLALEEIKEESESGGTVQAVRKPASRWRWVAIAAVAAVVGAGAWFLKAPEVPLKEVPLTSYPGYEGDPTLSPDGNQVAFTWDGDKEGEATQIYVSLVGSGTPIRLTSPPGSARVPAWSPDGQSIACLRRSPGKPNEELIVMPALGGPVRIITSDLSAASKPAWSPDGKWLYVGATDSADRKAGIHAISLAGGDMRRLTETPAGDRTDNDYDPAVAPDGQQLVFIRQTGAFAAILYALELRDGSSSPRRITSDNLQKFSPKWTADGQEVVYVVGEPNGERGIYRLNFRGGKPRRIEGIGDSAVALAIAAKGHRLILAKSVRDYNIWRMALPAPGGSGGTSAKFLSSTRYEASPVYSPDGKRIAFASNRGGLHQIWIADADGSNPSPVTNFTEGVAGSPRWSPDSQTIVFDARPSGNSDVYLVRANGGTPKRLTDHAAEDHVPCFSTDGKSIFFASTRSGQRQIYRMPANGGEALQVTRNGGFASMPSTDGKWIYYSISEKGLWKTPVTGGAETQVVGYINQPGFTVTARGIYFAGRVDPTTLKTPLQFYGFADEKVVNLGFLDRFLNRYISVSPDEKWLLYSQLDQSSDDLMLVENFR